MSLLNVLPPLLVTSLARFWKVDQVVLLSQAGPQDEGLDFLASLSMMKLDATGILIAEDLAALEGVLHASNGNSLLLDTGRFHRRVQDQHRWFRQDTFWLVPGEDGFDPPAGLRMDSNLLTISQGSNGTELEEWYRIKGSLYTQLLGTWSERGGLLVETPAVWERRKDMHGTRLRIATNFGAFFVLQSPGSTEFEGLAPDILRNVRGACNFSAEWTLPEDGKYGAPVGNGSWNGMVGMAQRKEVDLVVAALAVTLERSEAIDFTVAYHEGKSTLIVRNPTYFGGLEEINLTAYLSVFTPLAWLSLALVLLSVSVAHFLLFLRHGKTSLPSLASSAIAFSYKMLLQVGVGTAGPFCYKVLSLTAAGYVIVFVAYYEGMLTSFMTARLPAPRLQSFADAVDFEYQVVTLDGSKQARDLETAPRGSGRNLVYERLLRDNPGTYLPSFGEMAQFLLDVPRAAVASSEFSFPGDPRFLPLTGLNDAGVDYIAFGLQKGSDLAGVFNHQLVKMHQSGVLDFLIHKWADSREPDDKCGCNVGEEASALGYSNLLLPAIVLSCGGMLAMALVAGEALLSRIL